MISFLSGTVELIYPSFIVVNVSGVGYKVMLTQNLLSKVAGRGSPITIFTYTHVREDALELFGFESFEDLRMFEMLISVSGIGPKTALGAFALGNHTTIANAISKDDVAFFTSIPRLGKKNAQKIIIELRSKLGSIVELNMEAMNTDGNELFSALKVFGFSNQEIQKAIAGVSEKKGTLEEKIKLALKQLGK